MAPDTVPSPATATLDVAPSAMPPPQPAKQKVPRELAGLDSHLGQAWAAPTEGRRRTRLPASVSLAEDDNEYYNEHIPIYAAMATSTGPGSQYSDSIADPKSYRATVGGPQIRPIGSTGGLCVAFGGALVDQRSRRQKSTAQSTADTEYHAFGATVDMVADAMAKALPRPVFFTFVSADGSVLMSGG